jgi:hypothetical protein
MLLHLQDPSLPLDCDQGKGVRSQRFTELDRLLYQFSEMLRLDLFVGILVDGQ